MARLRDYALGRGALPRSVPVPLQQTGVGEHAVDLVRIGNLDAEQHAAHRLGRLRFSAANAVASGAARAVRTSSPRSDATVPASNARTSAPSFARATNPTDVWVSTARKSATTSAG
ncbi:hypothetical protein GS471_06310 [Rhodococcus hoagii]|nr:hypothetical protein [Prescottella equi]